MLTDTQSSDDFVAGYYRGHHFALMRHHKTWRVFLDYRLLEKCFFENAADAAQWLHREIDASVERVL
jgi:TPP-dependent pyruvate/acetoin dehydrogenase alpha subunit